MGWLVCATPAGSSLSQSPAKSNSATIRRVTPILQQSQPRAIQAHEQLWHRQGSIAVGEEAQVDGLSLSLTSAPESLMAMLLSSGVAAIAHR